MKKLLLVVTLACALGLAPFSATAQTSSRKKTSRTKAGSTKLAETKKPSTGDDAAAAVPAKPEEKKPDTPKRDDNKSDDKKSDDKKSDDKKSDDKTADAPGSGAFNFAGADFDLMKALSIEADPKGKTILTGSVRIESKDMNISCDLLTLDNNTHIMIATGGPVKLDQNGGQVQARCRNLTYHTDNKSALLENEAVIIQEDKGQKKQASADVIRIDYPPAEPGKDNSNVQPKVSLMNRNGQPVEIRNLNPQSKPGGSSKPAGAKKVSDSNLLSIPMPAMGKSPGVE